MKKKMRIDFEGKVYDVEVEVLETKSLITNAKATLPVCDDNIRCFAFFKDNFGKKAFQSFFRLKQAVFFNKVYSENITDHLNDWVLTNRIFAVFWGTRPYDSEIRLIDKNNNVGLPNKVLLAESGASLIYTLMDDGRVCVCLYRASTERNPKTNDYILIDDVSNPRKLLNERKLKSHWRKLLTCMENTCIAYKPNFISRIKMKYLDICYPYSEGNTVKMRRIFSGPKKMVLFLIPIFFSGIGLTIISCIDKKVNPPPIEREIENQKEIIEILKEIEQKSNDVKETLKLNEDMISKIVEYDSISFDISRAAIKNDSVIKNHLIRSNTVFAEELKKLRNYLMK